MLSHIAFSTSFCPLSHFLFKSLDPSSFKLLFEGKQRETPIAIVCAFSNTILQ